MKVYSFTIQGDKSAWQIELPGTRIAMEFDLDLNGLDAVQDFIHKMEGEITARLTGRGWTPSSDGFVPDRRKENEQ